MSRASRCKSVYYSDNQINGPKVQYIKRIRRDLENNKANVRGTEGFNLTFGFGKLELSARVYVYISFLSTDLP